MNLTVIDHPLSRHYLTVLRDRDNALVVPPKDEHALSAAIHDLIEHPGLAAALRDRGLEFVQDFAWHRVVDRLETAYGADLPAYARAPYDVLEGSFGVKA